MQRPRCPPPAIRTVRLSTGKRFGGAPSSECPDITTHTRQFPETPGVTAPHPDDSAGPSGCGDSACGPDPGPVAEPSAPVSPGVSSCPFPGVFRDSRPVSAAGTPAPFGSAPAPTGVELLGRTSLSNRYLQVDALSLRVERFDGDTGPEIRREIVHRGHAAALLPYDPERDRVVLLQQFRPGLWDAGQPAWDIEIVAGIVDGGDTPEATVLRECQEECGLEARDLVHLACYFPSPGFSTETISLFLGRVDSALAGGLFGVPEEGEDIRAFTVDAAEFVRAALAGATRNATALIAAQWLALNHAALREGRWPRGGLRSAVLL